MKRRTQIKFRRLGTLTLGWLVIGFLMTVYDHLVIHTQNTLGPSPDYSFTFSLAMNLGSAVIGAMLGGSFLIFYINERYQNRSYAFSLLAVSISFIFVILIIITVLALVAVPMRTGKPLSDPVSIEALKTFLMDSSRAKNVMVWAFVVAFTQLLLQINNKFGHGAFAHIIRGKYHTPKEEKRIFMFLDLNNSTTIAEQLGDEKYHALLKDFFSDITNPILESNGEIYQYVGDEVIVAWKHEDGIRDNQCIQCFFDIKTHILSMKEKYLKRYGLVPSFKAGIHCGKVVAGEVGVIKRDITYSGDVLNTTSRILTMCKEFNAEILTSADVIAQLSLTNRYATKQLGSIKLRGKVKEVLLSTLSV